MAVLYFYRDFYEEDIGEPMPFREAEMLARKLSEENESGVSEVLTYENNRLMIVATYCRGTKRYQGKRSRDAQANGLPPWK